MRVLVGVFLSLGLASLGCAKDQLKGAKAEVQETSIKLDLPPVPAFNMPQANPDGSQSVAVMRLKGNKFLDTEVRVKGYVVWIYDCATSIRTPAMTDKELAKLLEDEPERCTRPHITISDTPDGPADRGIWVVDIPRPLRKDDKLLGDDIYKEMEAEFKALPPFNIGDQISVNGTWSLVSPKGFRKSGGLLVYKNLENLTTPAPGSPSAPGAAQR